MYQNTFFCGYQCKIKYFLFGRKFRAFSFLNEIKAFIYAPIVQSKNRSQTLVEMSLP